MTIEAWVYRMDSTRCETIVSHGFQTSYWLGFCPRLRFYRSGGFSADADVDVPAKQWTHVAATLDGSTGSMRVYINGVLKAENFTAVRPFGVLNPALNPGVSIGNVTLGYDFPFRGGIEEVLLYSRALSPAEVGSLAGKPEAATSHPTHPTATVAVKIPSANSEVASVNSAVPADPLPALRITRTGQNITLAWPLWATNFVLQQADGALPIGQIWSDLPVKPGVSNNENVVTLPLIGPSKVYRLYRP